MADERDRLVDDESLDDPRFIRGAWGVFDEFAQTGNDEAALRVAEELARSWDRGNNIFDGRESRGENEEGQ